MRNARLHPHRDYDDDDMISENRDRSAGLHDHAHERRDSTDPGTYFLRLSYSGYVYTPR